MIGKVVPQENPLGVLPIKRMIWKFAIPGIISSLVNAIHNIVDQVFVGWGIGELGIAATNIAFPLAIIITALAGLLGMGGAAQFNLALGKGDSEQARKTLGNGLFLMVAIGITIAVVALSFLRPLLYAFGATDSIMPFAQPYTFIIALGVPFGIFATGTSYFIRADNSPAYSSAVLLSGAVFNIVFDPIFLFIFKLGIGGIALATVLGQVLSAVLALNYLLRKFKNEKPTRKDLPPKAGIVKGICGLGSAVCCTHLAATAVQIVQLNMLRHYGALSVYGSEIALAAAGAVGKVMIVLMSCVIGISLGCQPLYGFNYGAKKYDRVKETYKRAIRYGTTIAVVAFLCIQVFPRQILGIFGSDNPLFYQFAVTYMRIFLFMTFANALQPISSAFFTSMGKARLGLWTSLIKQAFLLIPLLLLLPLRWGIEGLFWAGPIADGVAALMVIVFAIREVRTLTKLQRQQEETGQATAR